LDADSVGTRRTGTHTVAAWTGVDEDRVDQTLLKLSLDAGQAESGDVRKVPERVFSHRTHLVGVDRTLPNI
jgi:hypothetical protein